MGEWRIGRNDDGSLDEIVAHGATVHLEQMDGCGWFLSISTPGRERAIWLRSSRQIKTYEEDRSQLARAALKAEPADKP